MNKHKRTYLDYASTTPIDERVFKKMLPYMKHDFYNASSIYKEGVNIKESVNIARKNIAEIIHAHSDEVVFTSGGTESNNLAILGVFNSIKNKVQKPHIITSSFEHPAVLEVCKNIEKLGGEVTYIDPESDGIIDPRKIESSIKTNTVLISIMYANNEIGTIQPIKEIGRVVKLYKIKVGREHSDFPYFHTDASQASNYLEMSREVLGVDLMTVDGSKIYGPKGVGLLFVKRSIKIEPIMFGGGQEMGIRPGTENVPLIMGLSEAFVLAQKLKEKESKRILLLRNYLIKKLLEKIPTANINGSIEKRLPNNVNVCIPGINAEFTVLQLDENGIMCSSLTACKSASNDSASYVIESIKKIDCARSSLRFTLGRNTSKAHIQKLLKVLPELISKSVLN